MGTNSRNNSKTMLVADDGNALDSEDSTTKFEMEVVVPRQRRRTRLEIVLFVVVIILLIIVAVLFYFVLNKGKSGRQEGKEETTAQKYCLKPGCLNAATFMYEAINQSADPCQDFFEYSCGGWIAKHPLPLGHVFYGVDSVISKENQEIMRQALEAPINSTESESEKKAMRYYMACMDLDQIESMGGEPLKKLIKEMGGWNISTPNWDLDSWDFNTALKRMHSKYSARPFFHMSVSEDEKNSSANVIQISYSRFRLLKSHYERNNSDPIIRGYLSYMTQVGVLLGGEENATRRQMTEVLELERALLKIFPPENTTYLDNYHKTTLKELMEISPEIDWLGFTQNIFSGLATINEDEPVVSFATDYFRNLTTLLRSTPKNTLNNFMMWRMVYKLAPFLSKPYRDAKKELTLALLKTMPRSERWRYCVSDTDDIIGMALGAMFVRRAFDGNGREQAKMMIAEIRKAFEKSLPKLSWMDNKTRQAAKEKADVIVEKIGFPPWILEPKKLDKRYEGMSFSESAFFENILNYFSWHLNYDLEQLRKPVDKNVWMMSPPTINAYYSPTKNQIVFPAGILQAPYYDRTYPKAVNFGGIGAVMGHELLHGFDNSGRLFDKYGNLGNQWWTNGSIEAFNEKTQCIINQYSNYTVYGKNVDGKKTLGENIADNGGLKAAFLAYKEWVKTHEKEGILPAVEMTNDQVFFISFAQSWCSITTKVKSLEWLEIDEHSPAKYRVLGSISNSEYFAKAFNCPKNSPMNPEKKCDLW